MTLDLLGLGVLAAGAAAGALAGAVRQVAHLAAIGLAALLTPLVAPLLAGPLARALPGPGLARAASLAVAFVVLFALLSLLGHALLRPPAGRERTGADRGLGALLGGLQAALGLWAALSLLVLWDRPLGPAGLGLDPRRGDLASAARRHNLVDFLAPALAGELRQRLPAMRRALEEVGGEAATESARKARQALEQAEKAGRDGGAGR